MTAHSGATLAAPEGPPTDVVTDPPPRASRAGLAVGAGIVVLAVVVRLVAVGPAYDLLGDEVDYVDLGTSLRHGAFPPVFPGSGPFLLHPPLFFAISAAWQILLQPGGGWFHLLVTIRVLNVVFAAGSAGCLYVLGTRLANRYAGVAAGLLFALDPYVLRANGRVLLETSTLLFVLLGYVILLRVLQGRSRHPVPVAVAAGLLLGIGIVGKDLAAVLVVPPLALLVVTGWGTTRRRSAAALVASLVPYGIYVAALAAVGSLSAFWSQETAGFDRLRGQQKTTGFSKAGAPSLSHTLVAQLSTFGTTYLVLIVALAATLYLLVVSRRPDHRLFAAVTVCGGLTVFYALFFGTIEEQFLYLLFVPALLSLAVGVAEGIRRRSVLGPRRATHFVAVGLLAVVACYDLGVWAHIRTSPDNGQQRIAAWFATHAPHPGIIGNDTQVTVYTLQRTGFDAALMGSPAAAAAEHIRYLTVLPTETANSYGALSQAQERFFEAHGRRVFSFHEATYGDVQIYETTDPAAW